MAGLNRILNKAIKAILKAVTTPLVNIATTCLFKSKILNCYKEIIIVVLQKVNKKDYLLLRSYQLAVYEMDGLDLDPNPVSLKSIKSIGSGLRSKLDPCLGFNFAVY